MRPDETDTVVMSFVPTPDDFTVSESPSHLHVSLSDGSPFANASGETPFTARPAFSTTASCPSMRATSVAGTLSPRNHISMRSRCFARTSGSPTRKVSSDTANAGNRLGFAFSEMSSPFPRSSFLYQ